MIIMDGWQHCSDYVILLFSFGDYPEGIIGYEIGLNSILLS